MCGGYLLNSGPLAKKCVNMQRIALGIEYDGANYSGWQRQQHHASVQALLEKAIAKIASHPIEVICAGRTDAGVHASGQVVHFDTSANRPEFAWIRGVNNYLPRDIRVCWGKSVDSSFNARKSALSRRYCYIILNRPVRPGILHHAVTWMLPPLDVAAMQKGAQHLLGTHDFTTFRASGCQAKTATRTLSQIHLMRRGDQIILDVTANAFLHHMVRNITGSLLEVGQNKQSPEWIAEILQARDRRRAGITAPPQGLYLIKVNYPDNYPIPSDVRLPWFF